MNEKNVIRLLLALPLIVAPVLWWAAGLFNLTALDNFLLYGVFLLAMPMALPYTLVLYVALVLGVLFWMRNRDAAVIRKKIWLLPLIYSHPTSRFHKR